MTRADKIMWTLSGLSAAMAVTVAFYAVSLDRHVRSLERSAREVTFNRAVTLMTISDVSDSISLEAVAARTSCESVVELQSQVQNLTSDQREILGAAFLNVLMNACVVPKELSLSQGSEALAQFLDLYLEAVNFRIRGEYGRSGERYLASLRTKDISDVHPEWIIRAREGLAYSYLKDGNLKEARTAITKNFDQTIESGVINKDNRPYVFEDITTLKIDCRERADPSKVKSALNSVRAKYDRVVQEAEAGKLREIAIEDRSLIEIDDELYDLCRYAGVSRQPLKAANL